MMFDKINTRSVIIFIVCQRLATVPNAFWSLLFADDTSIFTSDGDTETMRDIIDNDISSI